MFSTVGFANNPVENKDDFNDVFKVIKKQLVDRYGELYKLNNFDYDYTVREEDAVRYVDMNIYADMTLMRHPSDGPFVQGMKEALLAEEDKTKKKAIEKEIEFFLESTEEYYKKPNRSTFTYTIAFKSNSEINATNTDNGYKIFARTDAEHEIILVPVENLSEVENPVLVKENGRKAAQDVANREPELTTLTAFTYNRIAARDWARANAYATPEYPSLIVNGTDCANFVSKSLRAGGIPEDSAGNWYGSSTWGGWSGTNWLRTGYYNNGGVVPYMTGKGYFYKQSDKSKKLKVENQLFSVK